MDQLFSAHSGVPVPAEQPGSAKKGQTGLRYNTHSDKAWFYGGFYSEVINMPRDNEDHMLEAEQRFCCFFVSPKDVLHLQSPHWLAKADLAQLVCGSHWVPQGLVDVLEVQDSMPCLAACWPWHVDLLTVHRGECWGKHGRPTSAGHPWSCVEWQSVKHEVGRWRVMKASTWSERSRAIESSQLIADLYDLKRFLSARNKSTQAA